MFLKRFKGGTAKEGGGFGSLNNSNIFKEMSRRWLIGSIKKRAQWVSRKFKGDGFKEALVG